MQAIKSKDTSIELLLRKALWQEGIRYRKIIKNCLASLISQLRNIKLQYSVIQISGTDMTGKTVTSALSRIGTIGFQKSSEICKETKKLPPSCKRWMGCPSLLEWQIRKHLAECVDEVKNAIITSAGGKEEGSTVQNADATLC